MQFFALIFLLSLSGCNYSFEKVPPSLQGGLSKNESSLVSYQIIHNEILLPRCIQCHGNFGGVNLETYESVVKNIKALEQTTLISNTMPKNSSLTNYEKALLRAWINAGAPKERPNPDTPPVNNPPPEQPSNGNSDGTPAHRPTPRPGPSIPAETLTYARIDREVISPRCARCHGESAEISLSSYPSVKRNLSAIKRTVFIEKTMPQDAPLTAKQYNLLYQWIKKGAPQNGVKPPTIPPTTPVDPVVDPPEPPTPPVEPEPDPVDPVTPPGLPPEPTFDSIKLNIFESRCITCHIETGSGKRIPLSTKEDLLNSPLELVIPENPDESGLVLAITREDRKRMPPPPRKSLTEEEINAVKLWIQNGAKD